MAGRQLPKTLTEDELDQLLARPNLGCPTGLRNRAILAVLHRCGLRASEVCGLHLRDVDWKAGEIRIRAEVAEADAKRSSTWTRRRRNGLSDGSSNAASTPPGSRGCFAH